MRCSQHDSKRKVLDLVAVGRPIAQIAADLNISDRTIYGWRKQELIDTGQLPGLNRAELAQLSAADKRIRELETEVAAPKGLVSCCANRTTQKAVRGHSHHGRRGTARAGGMSATGGDRFGLLRMAIADPIATSAAPRMADRSDPGRAYRLTGAPTAPAAFVPSSLSGWVCRSATTRWRR